MREPHLDEFRRGVRVLLRAAFRAAVMGGLGCFGGSFGVRSFGGFEVAGKPFHFLTGGSHRAVFSLVVCCTPFGGAPRLSRRRALARTEIIGIIGLL